ncbi:hypothetical protein ACH4VX_02745 [Streptomyces sp. NPDC020731]|uniref:hypothetical protein n=1 Tax=Streptomyces sp. NPDC020731 TaxID=3365085 RepID=UPI003788B583
MTPTAPTEEPPAGTSRLRGRHRKPRPRKVLLAAGSLAVAASAVALVRLTTTQGGGTDVGTEAGSRPVPHTDTGTPIGSPTASTAAPPAPRASPSSPTVLGGKNPAPLTAPERSSPARTAVPDRADTPATPATPTTASPTTRGPHSPPPRQPPHHTPVPPPPAPHDPAPPQPDDPARNPRPGLCVPIIGICVGGGGGQ